MKGRESPAHPASRGNPPAGRFQAPGSRGQAAPLGTSHKGALMGRGPASRPLQLNVAKAVPPAFPRSRFDITGVLCQLAPLAGAFRRPTSGPPRAAPVRPQGLPVKPDSLGPASAPTPCAATPGHMITRPPRQPARLPRERPAARGRLTGYPVRPPGLPDHLSR